MRVGQAMSLLPKIAAAFEAGQLSFDKTRQITTVATALRTRRPGEMVEVRSTPAPLRGWSCAALPTAAWGEI